jgi:hypothetical protein
LAKQLGRWAHIYYTASVDKREAAIEKLVCELEAEEARLSGGGNPTIAREAFSQSTQQSRVGGPVLVTGQTTEETQPQIVEMPRVLDSPSGAEHPTFEVSEQPGLISSELFGVSEGPKNQQLEQDRPVKPVPEAALESWQELLRQTGSAPPADRWQPPNVHQAEQTVEPHPNQDSYISQDAIPYSHPFEDLLAKSEQIQMLPPSTQRWRLPLIAAAVLAVLGGSLWLMQNRHVRTGAIQQAPKPQGQVVPPPAVQPSKVQPPAVQPSGAGPSGNSPSAASPAASSAQSPPPAIPRPMTEHRAPGTPDVSGTNANAPVSHGTFAPAPGLTEAASASDPDLLAGMRELQGPQRNSAEAARHLWQSVKNQNSAALIPLAGLYAKGDGVSQDCDQAKILLDAATRQAKTHPQFLRLEMARADLRTSGCE